MSRLPKRSKANRNHTLHYQPKFSPEADVTLPVMTRKGPLLVDYLQRAYRVFRQAINDHKRVIVLRFDLTLPIGVKLPSDAESNGAICRFISSVKSKVLADKKRKGSPHKSRVRYIIAREVGRSGRPHFHVALLLNGNAYRNLGTFDYEGTNLFWMIAEAWASALSIKLEEAVSRVHYSHGKQGVSVYHLGPSDDYLSLPDAFERISYLCKADTKRFGKRHQGLLTSKK